MSVRYWWKDLDKSGSAARNVLSRESFKPLSATIWYRIKSAGILKPTRGKRGGIRPRLTETQFGSDIISATNITTKVRPDVAVNRNLHIPVRISDRGTIDKTSHCAKLPNYPTNRNNDSITTTTQNEPRHRNLSNLINVKISKPEPSPVPSLFLSNVCHISNKVDELQSVMMLNNASIAIITESWLNTQIPDSIINLGNNYRSHRLDRPTPGGGVLAYVSSHLPTTRLTELEESGKEVIWLLLRPPRTPRPYSAILAVGVYYPPGQTKEHDREMLDYLTRGVDSVLADRPSTGIIIGGDFNSLNLRPICLRFGLKSLVKAPTRGQNILDNILTNMPELYYDAQHLPPIGRSDHQCLLITPKVRQKIPSEVKQVRMMKPANFNALGLKLNQEEWEDVLSAEDATIKCLPLTS